MNIFLNKKTGVIAISCCGQINDPDYVQLKPNETDGALEKHVPVVAVNGDTVSVSVGEVAHPMTEAHLIAAVFLETTNGYQVVRLKATDEPKAEFKLASGEKPVAVYEYCNLHGLWMKKL